jgi:hypothetical protein
MEKKIYDLHEENNNMLNQLSFYGDEIKIMQSRIQEIAAKNNQKELLAQVEHFQNQLIIQKEQLDILSHNIRENNAQLEQHVLNNPIAIDHRKSEENLANKNGIEQYEKIFNELRHELNSFLSKTM